MKFNSFDELIAHLYGKKLSSLNFEITDEECAQCSAVTTAPAAVLPTSKPAAVHNVTFTSLSDKPVVEFVEGEHSILVVESFSHIPNACSTTKVNLFNRELTIGICESVEGLPIAKLDVIINGKFFAAKPFILKAKGEHNINTINLNA